MKPINVKTEKLSQAEVDRLNDVITKMRIQSLEIVTGPNYSDAEFIAVEAVISGSKFVLEAYIPPTSSDSLIKPTASNTLIKDTINSLILKCIARYITSEAKILKSDPPHNT